MRIGKAAQVVLFAAVGMDAERHDAWLALDGLTKLARRLRVLGIEEARSFEAPRLARQRVEDQPVIVAVGFWMGQYGAVDAFLLHACEVDGQRIILNWEASGR